MPTRRDVVGDDWERLERNWAKDAWAEGPLTVIAMGALSVVGLAFMAGVAWFIISLIP